MTEERRAQLLELLQDDKDCSSLQIDAAMDGLLWEAILQIAEEVMNPMHQPSSSLQEELERVSHQILGQAPANEPWVWRLWYAGQIAGLGQILKAHHLRQITFHREAVMGKLIADGLAHEGQESEMPIEARIVQRLHSHGYTRLEELSSSLHLERRVVDRALHRLSKANIVECAQEGTIPGARLTSDGHAFFEPEN